MSPAAVFETFIRLAGGPGSGRGIAVCHLVACRTGRSDPHRTHWLRWPRDRGGSGCPGGGYESDLPARGLPHGRRSPGSSRDRKECPGRGPGRHFQGPARRLPGATQEDQRRDRRRSLFCGIDAYKGLLALSDVNYVIQATPPHFRPIHLKAAIEAGKHVFMEKPAAVDAPGIRSSSPRRTGQAEEVGHRHWDAAPSPVQLPGNDQADTRWRDWGYPVWRLLLEWRGDLGHHPATRLE